MTARYTARDPHFDVLCGGCRWHADHRCMGRFEIHGGIFAGSYTCSCVRCGGTQYKGEGHDD